MNSIFGIDVEKSFNDMISAQKKLLNGIVISKEITDSFLTLNQREVPYGKNNKSQI